jgi:hypothetical protein
MSSALCPTLPSFAGRLAVLENGGKRHDILAAKALANLAIEHRSDAYRPRQL